MVGSVNLDTTYAVPRLPGRGETVLAVGRSVAPGGKGANQAVVAAGLGSRVNMLGAVGSDAEGALARDALSSRAVSIGDLASVAGASTGTAVILVEGGGENVIAVDAGANRLLDAQAVATNVASASYDVVLAQLEIPLPVAVAAARNKGHATFILNPAPMSDDVEALGALLDVTDVLVPNRPELARLVRQPMPTDPSALTRCVGSLDFAGVVIVTLGADGVAVYQRGERDRPTLIEAVPVEVVDATGAGDAFCGALAHFLAQHGDAVRAARQANRVAALSTTVRGARMPAELIASVR